MNTPQTDTPETDEIRQSYEQQRASVGDILEELGSMERQGEAQPQAVDVNEQAQDERQTDLSGGSEKQVGADPYARLKAYAKAGARIRCGDDWLKGHGWNWSYLPENYEVHPDDLHMCPEYAPKTTVRIEDVPEPATFEAHGKVWTRHTPGDPIPCEGKTLVQVMLREEKERGGYCEETFKAEEYNWGCKGESSSHDIVAYRLAEAQLEPAAQPWTPAVGDTVRLKSGGPVMTVTHVDPLYLMCAWMNASNELQVEPITTLCLTPAQP